MRHLKHDWMLNATLHNCIWLQSLRRTLTLRGCWATRQPSCCRDKVIHAARRTQRSSASRIFTCQYGLSLRVNCISVFLRRTTLASEFAALRSLTEQQVIFNPWRTLCLQMQFSLIRWHPAVVIFSKKAAYGARVCDSSFTLYSAVSDQLLIKAVCVRYLSVIFLIPVTRYLQFF